jgi:hypothetical protein
VNGFLKHLLGGGRGVVFGLGDSRGEQRHHGDGQNETSTLRFHHVEEPLVTVNWAEGASCHCRFGAARWATET